LTGIKLTGASLLWYECKALILVFPIGITCPSTIIEVIIHRDTF
jgi:hypothetical protein